ncbi:hypothetical protein [Virgibacillus salexigens]|uniref:hypothetical protein n=1 Tax=Virgibacillus salexigens TaxID=61016 RepID=UPI0030812BF3
MKTLVICKHCSKEGKGPTYKELEIEHSGIYEFKCINGHENISILQLHSFQLLYDLGIKALLDSYTREAVTSFAVSLERFREYCIDCFLYDLPEENKNATWKYVSSQSERQLGAFYFLYLSKVNAVPTKINNKWDKFRNDVIHKGQIPKSEEVLEYAEYVFDYINETLEVLYNKYADQNVFYLFLNKRFREVKEKYPRHVDAEDPSTISGPTFIDIVPIVKQGPDRSNFVYSFQEKLDLFEEMNQNQSSQGIKRLW